MRCCWPHPSEVSLVGVGNTLRTAGIEDEGISPNAEQIREAFALLQRHFTCPCGRVFQRTHGDAGSRPSRDYVIGVAKEIFPGS